jgi:Type II restriction endonuclease EcoO109I
MSPLGQDDIKVFVSDNIQVFHKKRLDALSGLKLEDVLKRKNPYLFKAKGISTGEAFVRTVLDAYLSSQEEGIFGGFLEELAIFVCKRTYDGQKSSAEGIDLEFMNDDIRYIVAIKSGPAWGNSSQITKMKDNFKKAKRILGTNAQRINIVAVNGCCYGRDDKPDKGDYLKLCGQRFWKFISGNENLYVDIIEPLGYKSKEKNDEFRKSYDAVVNQFTQKFLNEYSQGGEIN